MSRRLVALTAMLACFLLVGVGDAAATDVLHGIAFTKGCASPTNIGDPYACAYTVRNVIDEAQDTLTISGLADVVHAASGDQNSGNILGIVQVTTAGGATCAALSGDGSPGNPYNGVISCTLGMLTIACFTPIFESRRHCSMTSFTERPLKRAAGALSSTYGK